MLFQVLLLLIGVQTARATTPPPPPAITPPPQKIITRVVGELTSQTVTSREVKINDAIEQVLSGKKDGQVGYRILKDDDKEFVREVTSVLLEWAVFVEAQAFNGAQGNKEEIQKNLKLVQEVLAGKEGWKELEATPEEIRDHVQRKLIAKDFVRLKTDSSLVPITDSEAEAYYKKNRTKFGNVPFEGFRDNIKAFLVRQQTERRLKEWFEVLQKRYKVRNYLAG